MSPFSACHVTRTHHKGPVAVVMNSKPSSQTCELSLKKLPFGIWQDRQRASKCFRQRQRYPTAAEDLNYLNNHVSRIAKKLCKRKYNWRWSCSAVVLEMAHRAAENLNFIVVRMWKNAWGELVVWNLEIICLSSLACQCWDYRCVPLRVFYLELSEHSA